MFYLMLRLLAEDLRKGRIRQAAYRSAVSRLGAWHDRERLVRLGDNLHRVA